MNADISGRLLLIISTLLITTANLSRAAAPPPQTLNTPRDFPKIGTREEWETRARDIREQVLVSCGLWPMPRRSGIQPHIFDKIERDGYSIEKVYFETLPGFYLAGNLYRPLGRGRGPFPAILNPHGHWKEGRMADTADGSIAARCISFARQGMIAFSYDMVGYNDTRFSDATNNRPSYELHRQFGTNRSDQLWNICPMGLQTWNSIRTLDFLESLPGVDRKRLACTGESGGGTQTFILGAVDDRLAVQAPVVMVSHTMQGGCSCENAPGLRVEYSNMEIAAAAAPRPQILVAASGDWTKDTPTVEGPAIEGIYKLFQAQDKLRYARFDFGHNYNQTSREAVYEWFSFHLQPQPDSSGCKEAPYKKEPDSALRVFPEGNLPRNAASQEQVIAYLKRTQHERWHSLIPNNRPSLKKYKEVMLPAWRHTLQVDLVKQGPQPVITDSKTATGYSSLLMAIPVADGKTNHVRYYEPSGLATNPEPRLVVLAVDEKSLSAPGTDAGEGSIGEIVTPFLRRGLAVMAVKSWSAETPNDQFTNFFTTYNRTLLQERVRDLITLCASARRAEPSKSKTFRVILAGTGRAGLWALLAAPAADAVIADCNALDISGDERMLDPDLFCPGLRNIGDFEGAALLAAPQPLLLHNIKPGFPVDNLRNVYREIGAGNKFRLEPTRFSPVALAVAASEM